MASLGRTAKVWIEYPYGDVLFMKARNLEIELDMEERGRSIFGETILRKEGTMSARIFDLYSLKEHPYTRKMDVEQMWEDNSKWLWDFIENP